MRNIRRTVGFMISVCFAVGLGFFIVIKAAPTLVLGIFTNIPEVQEVGKLYLHYAAPAVLCTAVVVPLEMSLRAVQQTLVPLLAATAAFVTNTILNYMLIFGRLGGPQMGVSGAALATFLSRILEIVLLLVIIFSGATPLSGHWRQFFDWSKELNQRLVRTAIPTTINESLWGLGTAMYTAAYARIDVTSYAAVQAAISINEMFLMTAMGVGDAALIMIGQKIGENNTLGAKDYARRFIKTGIGVGLVAGVLLILCGRPITGFFGFTAQGRAYTVYVLIVFGCIMWLSLVNMIYVTGILRSGGDTRFAMLADAGTLWLFGLPVAFLTALVIQLPVYWCVALAQTEGLIKLYILHRRYRKDEWCRNLVRNLGQRETSKDADADTGDRKEPLKLQ